jgi:type I restriction enzyme S subunit
MKTVATENRLKETEIGMIPEDWEITQLQQISNVIDSLHATPQYSSDGVSMVRATDIKHGNLNLKGTLRVTRDVYEQFTKNHRPHRNDIVMSRVGTYFVTSFADTDEPFCMGQNTVVIHTSINSRFVYYSLNSGLVKKQIEEKLVGSGGQETLSLRYIRELLLPKPKDAMEIQRIAELLSCLDSRIELNRQVTNTLETIARAIFNRWFVDFEFPNEEGKLYRSSGGDMVYNEELEKEIPKGWEIAKLADLLDNMREPLKPGEELRNRKYVPIDNLPMNKIGIDSYLPYMDAKSSLVAFERDDILLGAMRVYFHRVCLAPFSGITRTTTFVLRPRKTEHLIYCLLFLTLDSTINYANAHSRGTTIPYAVWEGSLGNLMTLVPPEHILQAFNDVLRLALEKIRDSLFMEISLSEIRDLLLPKLMSGKVRVPV